ncbi:hypothetical protein [Dickeya dadantii]|uniref:hypothetical protein n=1 Tax=Dickeya dadantii TaxID=204038 RepID=UPI001C0B781F|nr:hypothetical protein [Dickeya dadantii]QWT40388.1 hypothetical protein KNV89_19005 [Dickeya dadantii]
MTTLLAFTGVPSTTNKKHRVIHAAHWLTLKNGQEIAITRSNKIVTINQRINGDNHDVKMMIS